MPKVTSKEKEVKEGANTIANSGSRDSRNGENIEKGTNIRAASISSRWDSSDNSLIYQRHRALDGIRCKKWIKRIYRKKSRYVR